MQMDTGTKIRIALLVVILLVTWAIEAHANSITLPLIVHQASNGYVNSHTFNVMIHGRPVKLYVTVNDDIWTLEVTELDEPTPTITVSPTETPGPYTGEYASLKTSSVYHKVTCSYLAGKSPDDLDYYATCEIARASGKRPCTRCEPCQ